MSDIISILPDSVANQIAAGEVVDRPASAVKELLENALDAGATEVKLVVKDAGRALLQVIDNGCGMSDSDARLCFERHATSKIKKADDLFAIQTMGFRGEALASIAAIAQVELHSRMHDSELGTEVVIEGSEIRSQTTCCCPPGTSIAVKNLFFNVPARRNFLKKESIELSHIEEIFRRVALVNCDVGFQFYNNGKMLYDLRAGNFAERISQMMGHNAPERLLPVEEETDVVRIRGYVGKPEFARKNRGEQYLFVNHRFVKHPLFSAAVEKAYTDLIPDRYYPSYFVQLDLDPSRIDINIHPTKTEVKFIDEQALFAIIRSAAKRALGQFCLATELEFNPCTDLDLSPAPKGYVPRQPEVKYTPGYSPFADPATGGGSGRTGTGSGSGPGGTSMASGGSAASKWTSFFDIGTEVEKAAPAPTLIPLDDEAAAPRTDSPARCLQLQNRYIVSTLPSGLLVVDQQAAHERILFERLSAHKSAAAAQQLLFPVNCQFSPADADIFSELLPDLKKHGFEIGSLGQTTFVISATPPDVKEGDLQQLFDQMLADYKCSMLQKFSDRNQCLCRTLAKQMSVRPGTPLQQEEMQQMVADLFCCQAPAVSPSGRKVMAIIPPDQLL